MKKLAGVCIVAAAVIAAIVPLPETGVERWYSAGAYPILQQPITWLSNRVPFALADIALVAAIAVWLLRAVTDYVMKDAESALLSFGSSDAQSSPSPRSIWRFWGCGV